MLAANGHNRPVSCRRVALRIAHVITGLSSGGAEYAMQRLVAAQAGQDESHVISLSGDGPVGDVLRKNGTPVYLLNMNKGLSAVTKIGILCRMLKQLQPDLVQTWMYHSNLVGGIAARLAGVPVVWGLHQAALSREHDKRSTRVVSSACSVLSHILPARIVCCGASVVLGHSLAGYRADRMVVVPNGVDTNTFRPNPAARRAVRAELGIPEAEKVVGFVGRMNPLKHPENFLDAAALLTVRHPELHFVMAGKGFTRDDPTLVEAVARLGLSEALHLLGPRLDVPQLMNAFDIFVLSSRVEGLPNVVAEAMASGVPCVVTDVGDARLMVGGTGTAVPAEDAAALALAIEFLVTNPTTLRGLGVEARARAVQVYGIEAAVQGYRGVYNEVLERSVP
jgi:glycosyltransferase involved in cell wall biosynthesis